EAERALSTSPELPAALFLAGACRAKLADRDGDEAGFERALDLLSRVRSCAGAQGTASRIARRLGRLDEALELARAGLAPEAGACTRTAEVAGLALPIEAPERALALAALAAWRARRASDPAGAAELFDEAEDALQFALGRPSDAIWVWRTLGEAYLEAGRPAKALATLEDGLERLRADSGLFDLIAQAAFEVGGTPEVVGVFARVQATSPEIGLAWWYPARAQFDAAVRGEGDARTRFGEAERAFAACRARDARLDAACVRYEVLCRSGRGWSWLEAGELERAWGELHGAGEHAPGGLELEQAPLRSARAGLVLLIERHLARGELDGAARAAEYLAEQFRGDVAAVRLAADLTRDRGERQQLLELDMKKAARGQLRDPVRLEELRVEIGTSRPGDDLRDTPRERDRFFDIGDRRGRAARETYLRALEHYRRALELAPNDLRLGHDAAVVVVRRLARGRPDAVVRAQPDDVVREQIDWAEALLVRLVEVGQRRAERGFDDDHARFAFDEAWADAHQLLGELVLEQRREPRAARAWFERCLALSPVPRPDVADTWLPLCLAAEREAAEDRR
ncbi:MAG TPA: tetratricopeptide repeat protein, partial [Planctomycetota bacterium]|nr:tetratricopeptide repeat protein [Planctomycetota bacterium]